MPAFHIAYLTINLQPQDVYSSAPALLTRKVAVRSGMNGGYILITKPESFGGAVKGVFQVIQRLTSGNSVVAHCVGSGVDLGAARIDAVNQCIWLTTFPTLADQANSRCFAALAQQRCEAALAQQDINGVPVSVWSGPFDIIPYAFMGTSNNADFICRREITLLAADATAARVALQALYPAPIGWDTTIWNWLTIQSVVQITS